MELGNAELLSHLLVVIDYEDDSDGKRKDQIRSSVQLLLHRLSLQTHNFYITISHLNLATGIVMIIIRLSIIKLIENTWPICM